MAWLDSLSQADVDELSRLLAKLGAPAFEAYVLLALRVRVKGPIPADDIEGCTADVDDLTWHKISGQFERRADGCLHLKVA